MFTFGFPTLQQNGQPLTTSTTGVLRHWAAVQAWRLVGEDVQRHGLHHGQATLLTAASCASSTARCRFLTVSTHSPCTPWMC
ncbi:uncharacterized protein LOC142556982 isoform X6 [Dermacentor variabilis]|uniref:uncharacterized protein LOC142556982 isoform X6 n=1 Tax=Dermacentor variabilis TaxID=34621 RepID=UPI003F5C5952